MIVWIAVSMVGVPAGSAQTLPAVGRERTLDVATWNIEHFGNDGLAPEDETQIANAASIIRQSAIDIWAIQEIEDENDFQRLVETVGGDWAGIVDEQSTNLHVGFLYDESVIRVRNVTNILMEFSNVFAGRPPLQIEVDVTLPDTSLVMTFITLHMKAFGDQSSYNQRESASRHLKNYIDYSTLDRRSVVILGDFNDELTASIASGRPSPYDNFLSDTAGFFFATLDLELAGANTYCDSARCASGSTIDHIVMTDELFTASGKGSAVTYKEVFDEVPFYLSTTSDHLPVYTSFHFPQNTSRERVTERIFETAGPFPNPAFEDTTLEFTTAAPGNVSIRLIDLLGREKRVFSDQSTSVGHHSMDLDVADLAAGTYFIHIRTDEHYVVKSFVIAH